MIIVIAAMLKEVLFLVLLAPSRGDEEVFTVVDIADATEVVYK